VTGDAAPHHPGRVVVVDLDGTLCPGDTLVALVRGALRRRPGRAPHVARALPTVAARYRRDPDAAKEHLLVAALGDLDAAAAQELAIRVAARLRLSPEVRAAVAAHVEAGDLVWLASASVEPLVFAVARRVGARGAVATVLAVSGGRLSGRYDGANCKGEEKLRRLDAVLPAGWRAGAVAYADSRADQPLMDAVAEARWVRRGRLRPPASRPAAMHTTGTTTRDGVTP
jgi:phosphatidylglycerophosphatase C